MAFKAGLLVLTLCIGSFALPVAEDDHSIFFDHTDPSARIVGGTVAPATPHMVGLTTGTITRNLLCGGSVITTRHVLTAAHCIVPVQIGTGLLASLRGVVGSLRFASGGTALVFTRGVIHHNYRPSPIIKNDIGILTTSGNIPMGGGVAIISINYNWAAPGVDTYVTGWGRTSATGALSQVLLRLDARTVDAHTCRDDVARRFRELNMWNVPVVDPSLELCTFLANGRGTCNGDSGSALVRRDTNQQIGVVSWGVPCALNAPDVFARTSVYGTWINQNIN
ncbi:unnamed protein product, partial [Brenthis ino]